eukprot:COSAG05_NODE_1198_length_5555_cov_3.672287_14_plen_71_part_00
MLNGNSDGDCCEALPVPEPEPAPVHCNDWQCSGGLVQVRSRFFHHPNSTYMEPCAHACLAKVYELIFMST